MRNSFLLLSIFVAAAACGATQTMTPDEARKAYPDADAVLLDGLEETEYAPDGTYVCKISNALLVLTEKGRREESILELSYNARYGRASIDEVTVASPGESPRRIDIAATTKETTDNSSASSNIYDPKARKIVCTVPGLKPGDTIRWRCTRVAERPRVENAFSDLSVLEWTYPVARQTYRVKAPAARPLRHKALRHPLGNVAYREAPLADGGTMHEWTATNSPQAFPEPDAPPLYTLLQHVRVSTAESWEELSRWYWNLSLPHLEKTTPTMTNIVRTILSALPADADGRRKIAAVFKWVSQEIRYMGLTFEEDSPGYAPHDVDVTFDNRYGVCRDKAALLAAMLRIAGFDAYPVLIHAGARMDPGVPTPFFNHAIAAARLPGDPDADAAGFILMDPTNESTTDLFPAYLDGKSYLAATPEGEGLHVSPVRPASANSVAIRSKGGLEKTGALVIESEISFKGLDDGAYRQAMLRRTPEERRRIFGNIVRGACGSAELISATVEPEDLRDTSRTLSARLLFRTSDAVLRGKSRNEFSVPFLSRALGCANWLLDGDTSLDRRRFPLQVSSSAMAEEVVEIDLGEGFAVSPSLPRSEEISGKYAYSRGYSVSGSKLRASRKFAVSGVEFSPDEYLELRENAKRVEEADRKRPAFAANPLEGADVRILRNETFCRVLSPHSWIATNTVETEILTYDGKKRSSELKFSCNPGWKTVEVVEASVSNRDGRVSFAGPREISTFDADWAAEAPRYPATSQIVVNLPSVEIGSVVRCVVATRVEGSPAPFAREWRFDSFEPADRISLDYADWTGRTFQREALRPTRLASEPMQPPAALWRDVWRVSHGDFAEAAAALRSAVSLAPCCDGEALADALAASTAEEKVSAVRNWMAKHVKIAGPSLYETHTCFQSTPPETVLRERYASRFDYTRTMCALMKGAGLDADIVFSADDTLDHPTLAARAAGESPDVASFSVPLCRVRARKGGFLGFGGETETWLIGAENEYAPLCPGSHASSRFLDPQRPEDVATARLPAAKPGFEPSTRTVFKITIRENGSADIDYSEEIRGSGVGGFRKKYAEMLPEERSRRFQAILGGISQAATATRELATDVESYPATLSFSAYVPGYATIDGGVATLAMPGVGGPFMRMPDGPRRTPVSVPGKASMTETVVETVFPEGFTEPEHLPEPAVFASPDDGAVWRTFEISSSKTSDGRLKTVAREVEFPRVAAMLAPDYAALLRERSGISSARPSRTVSARKPATTQKPATP